MWHTAYLILDFCLEMYKNRSTFNQDIISQGRCFSKDWHGDTPPTSSKSKEMIAIMKILKIVFLVSLFGLSGLRLPIDLLYSNANPETFGSKVWLEKQIKIIKASNSDIDAKVLRLSLMAYIKAKKAGFDSKQLLTVIDYSKPSTEKRLWVFNLKNGRTLFHTWVAHGKNTGGTMAKSFSNSPGSLKSSIGVFVTDIEPYQGGNGYSLRMRGLEEGVNDNAYDRDIVFHGAWYASPDTISHYGQLGRSWGCPAVREELAKPLIDTIKEQTVVFAYYPDKKWLTHSKYLMG